MVEKASSFDGIDAQEVGSIAEVINYCTLVEGGFITGSNDGTDDDVINLKYQCARIVPFIIADMIT
jgi:hypothetical protein